MSSAESLVRHALPFLCCPFLAWLMPPGRVHAEAMARIDAVRLVVERNPEVEAARNAYEAARARARQAAALPDPELAVEYIEVPMLSRLGDYGERDIGVSQRVEFPLKWWHRLQAGRRQAEAARLAVFEMARLDVSLRAKRAYDRIALQELLVRHTGRDLDLARDILRRTRIRFEAGDVPQLDVMRASVEVGRAANRLTAAKNGLSVAKTELNALLARPLRTPFTIADSLVYQPFETDLDQLTGAALRQRPDLSGTALELKALQSEQAAATAAFWPDLHVNLARLRRHGAHTEDSWRAVFSIEVPLWAFSRQRGERAEARARVAQVAAERDAARYQVLLETEEAYLDLNTAKEQVALFRGRILPEAERAFTVAGRSYDEGKLSYLGLLEAQRTRIETLMEYAHVLFEYRAATAALERAIAGPLSAGPRGG